MQRLRWTLALAVLTAAGVVPAHAQNQDWQNQWFWGVKGGVTTYSINNATSTSIVANPVMGGEWLITRGRTALYAGYSMTVGVLDSTLAEFRTVSTPLAVGFNGMRRIQIAVLVFPMNGILQPYVGGGFVIETLPSAGVSFPLGLSASVQSAINQDLQSRSSGGFFLTMIGAQFRMRKLAVFGHAQISPQGRDFLLSSGSTSFEFGVRYALTGAREDDVTTRR